MLLFRTFPNAEQTLREMCLYSELFWSMFSRIRTKYGEIRGISPYSVRMMENADQNNCEYVHFLCSEIWRLMENRNTEKYETGKANNEDSLYKFKFQNAGFVSGQ